MFALSAGQVTGVGGEYLNELLLVIVVSYLYQQTTVRLYLSILPEMRFITTIQVVNETNKIYNKSAYTF